MYDRVISLFTYYKYSDKHNKKLLKWSLDLRITGFVFNKTKYGWLFYYSQIDNQRILKRLDMFVEKQIDRFGLSISLFRTKKFVRTYNEIRKNFGNTKYIPNFDEMRTEEKRKILKEVFKKKGIKKMLDKNVEYHFNKRLYKTIKEFERDLGKTS